MPETLAAAVAALDQALEAASGVLGPEQIESLRDEQVRISARLGAPPDVGVVALAGGTGSGKSSLFNALSGLEAAATGGVRPTTEGPMAAVPVGADPDLGSFLERLGVEDRASSPGPGWLCLLDLPDTDSIRTRHRDVVARTVAWCDLVVWVTDPEKYRDASLHHGFLAPGAADGDRCLFALNHADRLDPADREAVVDDFRAALVEDGITDPVVVATAADPGAGPPIGVDRLLEAMAARFRGAASPDARIRRDLARISSAIRDELGPGTDAGFELEWAGVAATAARSIEEGDVLAAGEQVRVHLETETARLPPGLAPAMAELALAAPALVAGVAFSREGSTTPPPRFRPWRRPLDPSPPEPSDLAGELDRLIADPAREIRDRRREALAAADALAAAVASIGPGAAGVRWE